MHGKCKLCNNEAKLVLSHFIPKFVGKWVKDTSATGFIREINEIDKRAQDIAKEYWLCGECEDLFSRWEREFANKIFYPFVNEDKCHATYREWMSRFCASLSWRTLTFIRSKNTQEGKPKEYIESLNKAGKQLSKYLLGQDDNLHQYEQHLFPLEQIESTTQSGLPTNINRYLLRTMAMDVIGNSSDIMVYTKLPAFILLGFVKVSDPKRMRSSRIALKNGKISPRTYYWPDGFINYLVEKASKVKEVTRNINSIQQNKIAEYVKENPEKVARSKTFEAFLSDYQLFGSGVFEEESEKLEKLKR